MLVIAREERKKKKGWVRVLSPSCGVVVVRVGLELVSVIFFFGVEVENYGFDW